MSDKTPFEQTLTVCFRLTVLGLVVFATYTVLNGKPSGLIISVASFVLYLYIYLNGRYYLETFTDDCRPVETPLTNEFQMISNPNPPYAIAPIESVDDYEYDAIFNNENDKEITKEMRNKLMSQYPLSWTVQPPSSTYFQQGLKEAFKDASDTDLSGLEGSDMMYNTISGQNFAPPDMDSVEEKEREVLKTYAPKHADDLKTYNVDDAYKLIKDMYDVKGLIPTVKHDKDTNIYTVVGTRKKDEKVTYEDEGVASDEAVSASGEGTIKVPQAATDMLKDSDPFYNTADRTRQGKFDYTKFTPGLERTFSPSYPLSQWY